LDTWVKGLNHEAKGIKLQINLPQEIVKEPIDLQFTKMFMGGLGFNTNILYDEVGPTVDPLGPDNIVVISPGALNGTGAPTTCRTEISTKSPLTGIFGTGNFGGYWGQALKNAGYDTVVIRDRSPEPVYLLIDDECVEIRDAARLWGRDSWETADVLKEELGEDFSVMAIGQAGENLVRNATVIVDREHAPGRSHVGAVLGAKKLKAIAVQGTGKDAIKSPEAFEMAIREAVGRIETFPGWGATGIIQMIDAILPDYTERAEHYLIDGGYGFFCPCILGPFFGCNLIAEINEGKYAGTRVSSGITQSAHMAKNLGISLQAAFKLRELCQRYGLDFWEEPLAYFMELYQKEIITRADTDGLELEKGNEPAFIEVLGKIANREGFGDIIAEGTERASRKIGRGSEKYLRTMKGMEFFGDPRMFSPNKRLSYQINPRGGDDLKGTHGVIAFPGMPLWANSLNWDEDTYLDWVLKRHDMFDDVKEAVFGSPPKLHDLDSVMLVKWYNDLSCVYDSLGFCMFSDSFEAMGPTLYAKLYSAYTGHSITPVELMVAGERIFNVMRAYNTREGMRREHDDWPQRFYDQPLRRGDETYSLSKEKVDQSLNRYYELRGWDVKTGVPTQGKLRELQLHDVADDLLNYMEENQNLKT
jgi:aldehyde:ferredoxin oxidoreductase